MTKHMAVASVRLLQLGLLLPMVTCCTAQGTAPHGAEQAVDGAASIAELRQDYLDDVRLNHFDHVDKLFLWTGIPDSTRSMAIKHFSEARPAIASADIENPDAATLADYTHYHAHFNAPVLKMLKVRFVRSKDGDGETEENLFIGQSGGRFYFVTAIRDQGVSNN